MHAFLSSEVKMVSLAPRPL